MGLLVTQQQHDLEKQSGWKNLHCNNHIAYITLIMEKETSQQLYNEKLHSIIDTNSEAHTRIMLKKILKNKQNKVIQKITRVT